jgi:hypothetical protein
MDFVDRRKLLIRHCDWRMTFAGRRDDDAGGILIFWRRSSRILALAWEGLGPPTAAKTKAPRRLLEAQGVYTKQLFTSVISILP